MQPTEIGAKYDKIASWWSKRHYSSIGINANLKILMEEGLNLLHLELDQFPEKHVVLIAEKLQ